MFHHLRGFKCTSLKKHFLWTFTAKLFTRTLPLGRILKQRHKPLYNNFTCPSCSNNEDETWDHFINCSGYSSQWTALFKDTRSTLQRFITKITNNTLSDTQIQRLTDTILGNNEFSSTFSYLKSFATEAKFPKLTYSRLIANKLITPAQALSIAGKALLEFVQAFKTHVWKQRCDKTVEWKKLHNITDKEKHSYQTITSDLTQPVGPRSNHNYNTAPATNSHDPEPTIYVLDDFYPSDSNHEVPDSHPERGFTRRDRCRIAADRCAKILRKFINYKAWSTYAYPVTRGLSLLGRCFEEDS